MKVRELIMPDEVKLEPGSGGGFSVMLLRDGVWHRIGSVAQFHDGWRFGVVQFAGFPLTSSTMKQVAALMDVMPLETNDQ